MRRGHARLARFAAPAAFLAAATVAVLIVRSGLENGDAPAPQPAAATTTAAPATTAPPPATTEPAPAPGTTEPDGAEFYVIEAGDTLEVVAARHDTTVEALLALNPDVDPVALAIGDRIRVK